MPGGTEIGRPEGPEDRHLCAFCTKAATHIWPCPRAQLFPAITQKHHYGHATIATVPTSCAPPDSLTKAQNIHLRSNPTNARRISNTLWPTQRSIALRGLEYVVPYHQPQPTSTTHPTSSTSCLQVATYSSTQNVFTNVPTRRRPSST